jgi:NAD(P)-dependent dehydrogenase (short-subunit alcohol dehydrogenase family)
MTSQVVLVLGAGANIGKSIAQKFANTGFKVAIASRSLDPELVKTVNSSHKVDFSNPASVKDLFASVKAELGVPNVVIYNGTHHDFHAERDIH